LKRPLGPDAKTDRDKNYQQQKLMTERKELRRNNSRLRSKIRAKSQLATCRPRGYLKQPNLVEPRSGSAITRPNTSTPPHSFREAPARFNHSDTHQMTQSQLKNYFSTIQADMQSLANRHAYRVSSPVNVNCSSLAHRKAPRTALAGPYSSRLRVLTERGGRFNTQGPPATGQRELCPISDPRQKCPTFLPTHIEVWHCVALQWSNIKHMDTWGLTPFIMMPRNVV